ncbi:Transcriptional protein SWT1 [Halotydeus destructor]|nr:Transcriptional protein SWT1 [Halotydeus destructor]
MEEMDVDEDSMGQAGVDTLADKVSPEQVVMANEKSVTGKKRRHDEILPRTLRKPRPMADAKEKKSDAVERTVKIAKRSLTRLNGDKSKPKSLKPTSYHVLDTNVFMSHLNQVKLIISRVVSAYASLKIVVPSIVIQELDGLKNDKYRSQEIKNIIKFINEQFKAKSIVVGDYELIREGASVPSPRVVLPVDIGEFEVQNNDDRLLKVCLQIQKVVSKDGSKVSLITDDVNLQNKALSMNLDVTDLKGFQTRISDKYGIDDESKFDEMVTKNKRRKLAHTEPVSDARKPTKSTKWITKVSNADKCDKTVADPATWLSYRYECEAKLKQFIKCQLKKEYGDLWDKMFKINLDNFSLVDAIRVLRQGWIGTFSDAFSRNKLVRELIENMFASLKNEELNKEKLKSTLSQLMGYLESAKSS